ncbi:MAG: hypothetical protein IKS54_05025 [Erysipelotrichaceae bacterium]|nr:hypothetical protein [Erysipelotrichaceae bacterium]
MLIYLYVNVYHSSDYPAHVRQALRGEGYSLVSLMVVLLHKIDASNTLFIAFMAIATAVTVYACAFFIRTVMELLGKDCDQKTLIPIAASTVFICKLCIPEWSGYYYQGAFATQSWHNSTYTLMRLFAILTLGFYFSIEREYKETIDIKKLALFTLSLALSNLSKPNFVIVFAPIMLVRLIIDFVSSKGKNFRNAFIFGCCVLVSCVVLIFQFRTSFPGEGESGVAFSVSNAIAFLTKDKKLPLYLLLNYAFPIYVSYLVYFKSGRKKVLNRRIITESWMMVLFSILVYMFIVETGPRAADGNFGWGMPFFGYLIFAVCIGYLETMHKEGRISDEQYLAGKILYFAHIFFGIFYFGLLLLGYLSWGF